MHLCLLNQQRQFQLPFQKVHLSLWDALYGVSYIVLLTTPSVPIISIQFPFWDVPSFLYIPKIATFHNIKHYSTHYILPLSLFYNNKNTITPTTFLHYLKSIIKKYVGPTTLLTFHLTLLTFYIFSWSPCPNQMYSIYRREYQTARLQI